MTITDDRLRHLYKSNKLEGWMELHDAGDEWFLGTFSIHKFAPMFRIGWGFDLAPESHLLRRWFELPDLGVKGWAIIFHNADPHGEIFVGWVPPERKDAADRWIAFLNGEIRDRLVKAGKTPAPLPSDPTR